MIYLKFMKYNCICREIACMLPIFLNTLIISIRCLSALVNAFFVSRSGKHPFFPCRNLIGQEIVDGARTKVTYNCELNPMKRQLPTMTRVLKSQFTIAHIYGRQFMNALRFSLDRRPSPRHYFCQEGLFLSVMIWYFILLQKMWHLLNCLDHQIGNRPNIRQLHIVDVFVYSNFSGAIA